MSRNMIEANQKVFAALDGFCADAEDPVRNAGARRFIATEHSDREFLKTAQLSQVLLFGNSRALVRLDYAGEAHFCTVGFSFAESPRGFIDALPSPGCLTLVLAEVKVRPRATAAEIRNVLEAGDMSAPGYKGHSAALIQELFPEIRVLSAKDIGGDQTWRAFFHICIMECLPTHPWADKRLLTTLRDLCEPEVLSIPYQTLCRSIFDADPGALFLALYRCLEALYAYTSAQKVIRALKLNKEWTEVAVILEEELGWHPREEGSLVSLLKLGSEANQRAFLAALGQSAEENEGDLATTTARAIYKLRNGLVHYRPAQHPISYDSVDWNRLCEALVNLICDIYVGIWPVQTPAHLDGPASVGGAATEQQPSLVEDSATSAAPCEVSLK